MIQLEDTDVSLDFEIFYNGQYSLKKLSIEEYVRDPRFEVHMMAIATGDDSVQVIALRTKPKVPRFHAAVHAPAAPPWAEGLPIDCEGEIGEDFTVA